MRPGSSALPVAAFALLLYACGGSDTPSPTTGPIPPLSATADVPATVTAAVRTALASQPTATPQPPTPPPTPTATSTPQPPTATGTATALSTATLPPSPTATHAPTATLPPTISLSPTPSPTSAACPGCVLYQADWSNGLDGWEATPDWKVVDGHLVNDGTNYHPDERAFAPSVAGLPRDYVIEAEIQWVCDDGGGSGFGIVARFREEEGYWAGVAREFPTIAYLWGGYSNGFPLNDDDPLAKAEFEPGSGWHHYRLEVRGNALTLTIDGELVVPTTDNRFLDPGRVGLWSFHTQINVRSFVVMAL